MLKICKIPCNIRYNCDYFTKGLCPYYANEKIIIDDRKKEGYKMNPESLKEHYLKRW
jgi:hypothetical protein